MAIIFFQKAITKKDIKNIISTAILYGFSDIGYGNYLLTAPVERQQREFWKEEDDNSDLPTAMGL